MSLLNFLGYGTYNSHIIGLRSIVEVLQYSVSAYKYIRFYWNKGDFFIFQKKPPLLRCVDFDGQLI